MADFVDMIFSHAEHTPDKPAIAVPGTVVDYATLAKGILAAEEKILAAGLKSGDVVAISVTNPIGHFGILCACFRLGIASVSLHVTQIKDMELLALTAVLADAGGESLAIRTIPVEESWFKGETSYIHHARSYPRPDPDSMARLVLSSGTTGQSKVISLSYRAVQERLISYALRLGTPSWDRLVCIPGITTNFGFCFIITTVWLGRMVCFAHDVTARQAISAYQADLMLASTVQIASLVKLQEDNYIRLDSLRTVHIGGSVAFSPLLTKIRLSICENVFCGYGSTEAGTVAYAHVGQIHGLDHAVGFVAPWIDLEIVDDEGNKVKHPAEEGQVRIRAFGQGYRYNKISDTEHEIDRSEWFYPGDRGKLFKNGLLIILGRIHDIINKGGVKVAPERIEEGLKEHPAIVDAAAVGVLNEIGIEQIWVGVVAREPTDIEIPKIYDYCREKMPGLVPDRIFTIPTIPRNQLGKIVRESLKEELMRLETEMTGVPPSVSAGVVGRPDEAA